MYAWLRMYTSAGRLQLLSHMAMLLTNHNYKTIINLIHINVAYFTLKNVLREKKGKREKESMKTSGLSWKIWN